MPEIEISKLKLPNNWSVEELPKMLPQVRIMLELCFSGCGLGVSFAAR